MAFLCVFGGCSTTPTGSRSPSSTGSVAGPAKTQLDQDTRVEAYARFASGLVHEMNQQSDQALVEFQKSALADPSHFPLVIEVGRRLLRDNRTEEAVKLLEKSGALPNSPANLHALLGLAHSQQGNQKAAMKANRTALEKDPSSLAAYQNLLRIYFASNQTDQALGLLKRAARENPNDHELLVELASSTYFFAQLQSRQQPKVRATLLEVLQQVHQSEPTKASVLFKLGENWRRLDEKQKAIAVFEKVEQQYPDLGAVTENLTNLYLQTSNTEKARQKLKEVLQKNPTNAQAYYFLGTLDHEAGDFESAVEQFRKAILLNPEMERAYFDLTATFIGPLQKPDQAHETLDQAQEKFPQSFLVHFYRALTFASQQDYSKAVEQFQQAESLGQKQDSSPLSSMFYYQYGSALERYGDYEKSTAMFRKSLELNPENAQSLNYLGYMWADRGVHLIEAKELIEKAVQLEPENAAYLDSMAWVLYRLQRHKEALAYQLKAVKLSTLKDPTLYDHLGDIYAALEQWDNARQAWSKALELEHNPGVEQKLEQHTP